MRTTKFNNIETYRIYHNRFKCFVEIDNEMKRASFNIPDLWKTKIYGYEVGSKMIRAYADILYKIADLLDKK